MLTMIENLPAGIIGFEAHGRVTYGDQAAVLEPCLRAALETGEPVRLLYVMGPDFTGYDPGALLDNAVFGSRHFRDFERIAFLSVDGPYRRAIAEVDGLMPADLKTFEVDDVDAAMAWLASEAAAGAEAAAAAWR